MNKRNLITALLAIVSMEAMAQTDSTAVKNDSVMWDQSLDGVTVTAQRQLIKQLPGVELKDNGGMTDL